jgi:ribosomal protein S18 acetylase RimI-like enzyme
MTEDLLFLKLTPQSSSIYFEQIARIHKEEIREGFLSTFGVGFLAKLYKAISQSPFTFLIAAIRQDCVLGFIVGSQDTNKFYKYFLTRYGLSALPLIIKKIFSFKSLRKVLEIFLYPQKIADKNLPNSEILNFCVTESLQGMGIGKKLFYSLVDEFKELGFDKIKIVTGGTQNKAQIFYESCKATLISQVEVHRGEKSLVYVYLIE